MIPITTDWLHCNYRMGTRDRLGEGQGHQTVTCVLTACDSKLSCTW